MENLKQVVVLQLGEMQYGFPIDQVNEIIRYLAPSRMPNAPDYMEGLICLRGKVLAAINLRTLLGMEKKEPDGNTKIIISSSSDVGFIVDEVTMIVTPQEDEIDTAAGLVEHIDKSIVQYIIKINGDIIVVLNMASILKMHACNKY